MFMLPPNIYLPLTNIKTQLLLCKYKKYLYHKHYSINGIIYGYQMYQFSTDLDHLKTGELRVGK